MIIEKKVWPEIFEKLLDGTKKFEVRLADFACKPGDIMLLREWDPMKKEYTGRELRRKATYVLKLRNYPFYTKEELKEYGLQVISLSEVK